MQYKDILTPTKLKQLYKKLNTNPNNGITGTIDDIQDRINKFGKNEFPEPVSETWFELFFCSFADETTIVLIIAAIISFVIGLYEDPLKGWIEGAAILLSIIVVACVTATNDYNKAIQFKKLNSQKDDITLSVIRDSNVIIINIKELLVGDIVKLDTGDKIPADGIVITSSSLTCDESSLTGETDDKTKISITTKSDVNDCHYLWANTTISQGIGTMLVLAVGPDTEWGKTKSMLAVENFDTPLQEKLKILSHQIGIAGIYAAVATFIGMMIILYYDHHLVNVRDSIIKAAIMAITIVVVAVPEGMPLAVTLSLAYSSGKMVKDQILIRELAACETMGNVTNICSDKTGTLTQNKMTIVEAWIANEHFNHPPRRSEFSEKIFQLLSVGISVNTTAELIYEKTGTISVIGSKTDGALLQYTETLGIFYSDIRYDFMVDYQLNPFTSERKSMSILLKKIGMVYCKGAAEIILNKCNKYINANGNEVILTKAKKQEILRVIKSMADNSRRAIVLAHKYIRTDVFNYDLTVDEIESDLVFDALFGIHDPLRPDVPEAIRICQEAGITVRMVTGDNLRTAIAIAKECGILTTDGIAIEGEEFRNLHPQKIEHILPKLQVLARASSKDKHTLVTKLNGNNLETNDLIKNTEVVAVTGDGTNDAPALKAADVGISMGLSGTDVAKDASDIVILDDNFASIVKSIMWGRSVFDNIRKFLQFQLTVNIVAVIITFISAITGNQPPLNAVMMLWVNIIMDTLGALALGTEPPSPTLLSRRPYKRNSSLISYVMWRNIIVQSVFQIGLLAYLLKYGAEDFGILSENKGNIVHTTIVFNTFVFCQVFNEFNARSINSEFDIFANILKNPVFLVIIFITVTAQFFLVQFGGDWVRTTPLTIDQWYKSVLLGALSIPIGGIMRLIPIKENENDFAEVNPFVITSDKIKTKITSTCITMHIWLGFCVIIPAIVYNLFGNYWLSRL